MDKSLLDHYNRELRYLRTAGAEFAREFPGVASHLAIDHVPCPDPYVERLLEGCAFLAARVQTRIDAGFPRFTQSLLETIYPHFLAPTPSMTVVRFDPDLRDKDLKNGVTLKRDTVLRAVPPKPGVPGCTYLTAHPVTLIPITVEEARYYRRELATLDMEGLPPATKAAAYVRLRAAPGISFRPEPGAPDTTKIDRLTFFLGNVDTASMRLYEQLFANVINVFVRVGRIPGTRHDEGSTLIKLTPDCISRVGFSGAEAMLPYDPRTFQGYRLLHEYFAFPQRFMFVEFTGLAKAFEQWDRGDLEIIVALNKSDPLLESLGRDSEAMKERFQLFCTPAVNLFPKQADHIFIAEGEYEYPIIPDRARPLDFEVYRVDRVLGYATRSDYERAFAPFYSARDESDDGHAFFATHRTPRGVSDREVRHGRRTSYGGTELFLSLVDAKAAPFEGSLNRLQVDVWCTNRDLPLFFEPRRPEESDFTLDVGAPIVKVKCVAGPSKPWPSAAEGETLWRLISHLALNYVSLVEADEGSGAAGIREMMQLYGEWAESQVRSDAALREQIRKQIESVVRIDRKAITHRLPRPGPITFARGLELTLLLDESGFEGTGPFLFGAVLEQFFARYVSINSFTQTVVRTIQRLEVMRWPSTLAQRPDAPAEARSPEAEIIRWPSTLGQRPIL